jgi:hypothetical protein
MQFKAERSAKEGMSDLRNEERKTGYVIARTTRVTVYQSSESCPSGRPEAIIITCLHQAAASLVHIQCCHCRCERTEIHLQIIPMRDGRNRNEG